MSWSFLVSLHVYVPIPNVSQIYSIDFHFCARPCLGENNRSYLHMLYTYALAQSYVFNIALLYVGAQIVAGLSLSRLRLSFVSVCVSAAFQTMSNVFDIV